MNRIGYITIFLFSFTLKSFSSPIETMKFGAFGKITIYKPISVPEEVVLFISGDGGWNTGVIEMARNIVKQGAIVVGINIQHYFKAIKTEKVKCYYLAGDFEELSLSLQKKYKISQYLKPILVGYSSGATLAYGLLAQAPSNTFKGAIALGFCPDIDLNKTLCNGSGLNSHILKEGKSYYLETSEKLTAPFIVLQGMDDKVCSYTECEKYMKGMHLGELISLPKVGHGFGVTKNWLPEFISAFKKIQNTTSYEAKIEAENTVLKSQHITPLPSDLPLTLVPSNIVTNLPMAFVISGDGGWTSFDQTLSEHLAKKGISVVGLDAQKYFWNAKTPEESSAAISKAILYYMHEWNKKTFILTGYSFGACVAPFIADHFSVQLKEALKGVYCLSPDETGDFEIHLSDMLNFNKVRKYNVLEEVKKIKTLNPICFFGEEEENNVRNHFIATGVKVVTLSGNHHYNNDFNTIAENVLKTINKIN